MKTVSLTMSEIIDTLDPINRDAFDQLYNALQRKVIGQLGSDKWLEVWNSDCWTVKLNLEYEEEV